MTEGRVRVPRFMKAWGRTGVRKGFVSAPDSEGRLGLLLFMVLVAFSGLGPLFYPLSAQAIHPHHLLAPPSLRFLLGTDDLGRDLLARLMRGGQPTLEAGFFGTLVALAIGTPYGLLAALGPRWLGQVLMRLLDALLAIPTLVLMIFFSALIPLTIANLILLLGLVSWPGLARLVRNEALAHSHKDYIAAARQFGAGSFYIARVHILRAIVPMLVVNATFLVADLILALSGLSFLGLGIQPPHSSWGGLLNQGAQLALVGPWWLIVFPGLMIFLAILAMNMLGQGLLARLGVRG